MLIKTFSIVVMIVLTYGILIFLTPDFIDTYGDKELNEKIRMWKRISELDNGYTTGSLIDQARDIARPYLDDTQQVVEEIRTTGGELRNALQYKTDQAKDLIEATQNTYNSVEEVKEKLDSFTRFGSGQ